MVTVLSLDECCYIYTSVPRKGTNCVLEGDQLNLNYIIYNPHDMFTNLTVTWFKSTNDDIMLSYKIISTEHHTRNFGSMQPTTTVETNCSLSIYKDTYGITIENFTTNNDGYYWCQLSINSTKVQPSHHAWFYAAANCSLTTSLSNFRLAYYETQCAKYLNISSASLSISIVPTLRSLGSSLTVISKIYQQ